MSTHTGYRTANLIDPDTGLCATAQYGFGKLRIEDFAGDPILEEEDGWDGGEESKREAVETANERARRAEGRYSSVDAAKRALLDAGYDEDCVYQLEWY